MNTTRSAATDAVAVNKRFAEKLLAHANGDFEKAAKSFSRTVPGIGIAAVREALAAWLRGEA